MRVGEQIHILDGVAKVARIERGHEPTTVYNLEVHGSHTYYVGESHLWTHNACSANQVNQLIQRGGRKIPRTLKRAEFCKVTRMEHLHFTDSSALTRTGVWRHGGKILTNLEKDFIARIGWMLPK